MSQNTTVVQQQSKGKLSVKTQTLAAITAMVAAVALPQFLHVLGAVTGQGNALGEIILPMHLPIILAGILAGPYAGAIAGFLSPLISFALSGMPGQAMLPFMMLELCIYGLCAGMLRNIKMPSLGKVVLVQLVGRVGKALAILFAFYALGNHVIPVASVWMGVKTGLPGMVLQWVLIPLLLMGIERMRKDEESR